METVRMIRNCPIAIDSNMGHTLRIIQDNKIIFVDIESVKELAKKLNSSAQENKPL